MAGLAACTCSVHVATSGIVQCSIEEVWAAVKAWGDAAWMGPAALLVRTFLETAVHVHLHSCARPRRLRAPASQRKPSPELLERAGRR